MSDLFREYKQKLINIFDNKLIISTQNLAKEISSVWKNDKQFFLCGNGGSAGNSIHIANDFLYGIASNSIKNGMRVESLSANSAVITCLANDIGYEKIYSEQLKAKGKNGDLLVVLSGSGNSPNVVNAIVEGNKIGMKTFAIVGFDGGECKKIANHSIHFEINDMQISEDLQLIVLHMCMQWIYKNNS